MQNGLLSKYGGKMKKLIPLCVIIIVAGCSWLKHKGSISGTVTNGGNPVSGAIVLAIGKDSLIAGESIDYTKLNGTLTGNDGRYKIQLVEPGTYFVVAIKDVNNNFTYEPEEDLIGWYGERDTLTGKVVIPKSIEVEAGKETRGVDIDTMYVAQPPVYGTHVWINCSWHSNGDVIHFNGFSSPPTIVTSAQAGGVAKMVATVDNGVDSCWLSIYDHSGEPAEGWVQIIAIGKGDPNIDSFSVWRQCAWHGNGDVLQFVPEFDVSPVIVSSAQAGGVAEMACAVDNATDGCWLSMYDHNGNPAAGWVQTIAMARGTWNEDLTVWTEVAWHEDGDQVEFSPPFKQAPVIITSGQAGGVALMVCAVNNAADGCWLTIRDHKGNSAAGWVQIIAIGPKL